MNTVLSATPDLCLNGHAWTNTGMDVQNGELVHTGRCVWCGKEASSRKHIIRPGVRRRP